MKRLTLIAATFGILASVPARAQADLFVLNCSGTFRADTTIGGTPLGADTPFTIAATFDSAIDAQPLPGFGAFETVSVVIDIAGIGIVTGAPGAGGFVQLIDASAFGGIYAIALFSGGMNAQFSTASPPFSGDSPSPSVLSGLIVGNGGFILPLAGGAGDLIVSGLTSFGPTATITATAVPEPSSLALLGIAASGCVGLAAARRRRSAGAGRHGDALESGARSTPPAG